MKVSRVKTGFWRHTSTLTLVCLVVFVIALGGCKGRKGEVINPDLTSSDSSSSSGGGGGTGVISGLPDVDQANIQWRKRTDLKPIYFDFDSFALRPDALATLLSGYTGRGADTVCG